MRHRTSKLSLATSVAVYVLAASFAMNAAARESIRSGAPQTTPPYLVVSVPSDRPDVWRLALRRGTIKEMRSCIAIATSSTKGTSESSTIIFPAKYPYSLEQDPDGRWVISDSRGRKWAAVGDKVAISGRVIENVSELDELVTIEDRRKCPGPYWELTPSEAL